jgi:type III secretion system YscQ/HrcQ family protein
LKAQHSPIASIKIIELVRDVSGLTSLPRLNASSSIVFVERFDYGDSTAYPHAEKSQRLEHGVLTCVEFVAGYTKFPIGSLSKIEIGDVLLIDNTVFRVSCSGRALFTYTLNQGSIMIEEQIQIEDQHFMQQDARYTEQPINLDDIPVELSFVLMEKSIPFSELKTFAPGEVIALPQEQVMRVEIRANQRSIGRGELVQLTNGQLAVEIRQLLL